MARTIIYLGLLGAFSGGTLAAQSVISAKSGMVHYTEGLVYVNDEAVTVKVSQFPEVKERSVLRTEEGRAEVLLTPGVILRLAENSSVRMLSNKLWDVKVELLTGDILIEAGEVQKDQALQIKFGESLIDITKRGLFRLSAASGTLKVFEGEASVVSSGQRLIVKEGRQTAINTALVAEKFDREVGDSFHRWAGRRTEALAMANLAAARSSNSLYSSGNGAWQWNPAFGMFTYVPLSGSYYSPFGAYFFSNKTVSRFYERPIMTLRSPDLHGGFGGGGFGGGGNYPTVSRGSISAGASSGGGVVGGGAAGGGASVGGGRSADGGGTGRGSGGSSRGR